MYTKKMFRIIKCISKSNSSHITGSRTRGACPSTRTGDLGNEPVTPELYKMRTVDRRCQVIFGIAKTYSNSICCIFVIAVHIFTVRT